MTDGVHTDYDDVARRKYKKDIDALKPDMSTYNKHRAAAQQPGASSSTALVASEDLYRDANTFVYADHKPTDDAIDRVIGKINMEFVHLLVLPLDCLAFR